MHLVTLRTDQGTVAGRVEDGVAVHLDAPDVGTLLATGGPTAVAPTGESTRLDDAEIAPVIPNPDKIVCVGVNYADHIAEMGRTPPGHPTYFAKYRDALIGANDDIWLPDPSLSTHCDWEGELVCVVGQVLRHASPADARSGIAGFTVGNDFSVRDFQRRTSQFLGGKTFEHGSPVGPTLVTADELGDGSGLALTTAVNGEVKQQSNTSNLVFGAVDILVDLSRIITLLPGDIVFTGTPGGVGAARTPPEWLGPGDVLTTTIEGIGTCTNTCVVPDS